ncbi:sugar-transfer associated ATP-grasp domain-containing protein [Thioalkalivibrio sp. ALE16]|uniref:sugar-transfer associated ATP-grasp domain-containing protein n=1 Tax=Thioalkalivibrio sp. ALE16 TaxID=1158172 RepID=UPI0009DBA54B|nr:sugar-transfer associated ATP-grasp domain-containing protein [Thioalkalivibrio sp. ALE16]
MESGQTEEAVPVGACWRTLMRRARRKMLRHVRPPVKLSQTQRAYYRKQHVDINDETFARFYKAGLLDDLDRDTVERARAYQLRVLGRPMDVAIHAAFHNLHGYSDSRLLPRHLYWHILMPFLNDLNFRSAYSDKNLYHYFAGASRTPISRLKCVAGNFYDSDNVPLSRSTPVRDVLGGAGNMIIKPSRTDNGCRIASLYLSPDGVECDGLLRRTVGELSDVYGANFVVQEKLAQHPVLAAPHPPSVNTLRILTLRWSGEIHYLLAFARFGTGGAVNDNAGTGGICVGIAGNGALKDHAVTEAVERLARHPDTGYEFGRRPVVPAFERAVNLCKDMHRDVLHHNLVSWDIAIDVNEEPVFIEHNFRGALWLYQMAVGTPALGTLTDEVLSWAAQQQGQIG